MNKWLAIFFIYMGSVFYTLASFYHLSLGTQWTFFKAYMLALVFVLIEYLFNIKGNHGANKHVTVFQIMILIIAFDLINLYILNYFVLKNKINVFRDGISLLFIGVAIAISSSSDQ